MIKLQNKTKIATIALILTLTISSIITFLPVAYTSDTPSLSTIPSNLLQYEWPYFGGDYHQSYSSAGPAPNMPNIKWKTQIPDVGGNPVAFNGMVFVQAGTKTYALDGDTGEIVWTAELSGSIGKIDDTYMFVGTKGVKTADGTVVWTATSGFSYGKSVFVIPELKMAVDGNRGWSIADPSQPPTLVWDRTNENLKGDVTAAAYGDGKLFMGTYDNFFMCIDALTGTLVWVTPSTSGMLYGGTYIDGKFIHGGLDNTMSAWDGDTGELLWTYNPGTWYGMWASAVGSAYGMVYEHNQDTYLYAINADTGEMVWRQKGPGIGYSNRLMIADGKVYNAMGENQYRDFDTGEWGYVEYTCYDAFTGELIWTMPIEDQTGSSNAECIAYGNMYVIPMSPTPQDPGVWTYRAGGSLGEVWCISSETVNWPMYLADPEHSAEGAGPTNLAVKWKFKTDATIQSSPTLVDGVCYFGNQIGNIYALDADTGTQLWTFKTDQWVKSTVAVVNGKLYTGTDDGNIYCLNAATGAKIWEIYAGGVVKNPTGARTVVGADNTRSSPIILEGRVYVGALDGNLYCLDANTGAVIWKFQTGGPIMATPTIVDNEIYIPASTPIPDGTVYKLDLNGNVIWQKAIPYNLDKSPGSGDYMLASATVAEGKVFLRQPMRLNYALDATTGETIWTYDGKYNPNTLNQLGGVHQFMPMLYKYGRLYFNDFYGITCLDASDGTEIWHSWMSRENLAQALTYSFQRIYTVTEFGVLYVLDALSGAKLSYYEFVPARSQLHCMPVPYNGSLYVGANDWNMYCFGEARLMDSTNPEASVSPSTSSSMSIVPEQSTQTEQSAQSEQPAESLLAIDTTTEQIIIAVIVVAIVIGIIAYGVLRKRK